MIAHLRGMCIYEMFDRWQAKACLIKKFHLLKSTEFDILMDQVILLNRVEICKERIGKEIKQHSFENNIFCRLTENTWISKLKLWKC